MVKKEFIDVYKKHKLSVGAFITIIASIIGGSISILILNWYNGFMGNPEFSGGEKQIVIIIIISLIIISLLFGIIFIELKEIKNDILKEIKKIKK